MMIPPEETQQGVGLYPSTVRKALGGPSLGKVRQTRAGTQRKITEQFVHIPLKETDSYGIERVGCRACNENLAAKKTVLRVGPSNKAMNVF